ncbi:MAG: F0F1 ATP synthase subunit B [Candidatus Berkelbacteria bacterium]|nr:F0F1 ATP synthase subunit B [Candidatus Berkelbacteria bacterium]
MDALSALGIDGKLLIAQIINFLILMFLLYKFLYNPILKILKERQDKIAKGLKDSELSQKILQETEEKTRKLINKANQDAEKIVQETKKSMEEEASKAISKAQTKSEEILVAARNQAKIEQDQIFTKAKKEIADLVATATEKILETKQEKTQIAKEIEKIK